MTPKVSVIVPVYKAETYWVVTLNRIERRVFWNYVLKMKQRT